MNWNELSQLLAADGYIELIEETGNEPYLQSCLHSLDCTGPTFFHCFGRGLEIKVIARCASCGRARDLTAMASGSLASAD